MDKPDILVQAPCPICLLPDGFHDREIHQNKVTISKELLKDTKWWMSEA